VEFFHSKMKFLYPFVIFIHFKICAIYYQFFLFNFVITKETAIYTEENLANMESNKTRGQDDLGYNDPAELMAVIIEAFSGLIFLFDLNTRKNLYSSENLAVTLGYSGNQLKELGNQSIEKLVHPDDVEKRDSRYEKLKGLQDGEVNVEKERYKHADGTYRTFVSRIVVYQRDNTGMPQIMLGISYDVTQQEQQRQELEKLALIAQKTTNGIIITNADGKIEWVNNGYENLTGFTMDEIVGHRPSETLIDLTENHDAVKRMLNNFSEGKSFTEEFTGFAKNGNQYWIRVFADPIFDKNGQVERFIAIAQNITELVQNRESLLKSNERLKHFAFFTSHQLRAPVADILSILDVFDYANPANPDNIKLLTDLRTVSQKLDEVIHDMNAIVAAERIRYTTDNKKSRNLQHVMLVDDDKVFNNITGMILKRLNNNLIIQSYTNAALAIDVLKNKEQAQPDAIFLDINMPEINAWGFLDRLGAIETDVHVYILTSSIDPADMEKAKTYKQVKGYFTKPLTKKILTEYFDFAE
jgi:PAS domain S-box-containing protein